MNDWRRERTHPAVADPSGRRLLGVPSKVLWKGVQCDETVIFRTPTIRTLPTECAARRMLARSGLMSAISQSNKALFGTLIRREIQATAATPIKK
ncbi:MAG: hypothetical protein QM775_31345 [Pirellulales bacterium]